MSNPEKATPSLGSILSGSALASAEENKVEDDSPIKDIFDGVFDTALAKEPTPKKHQKSYFHYTSPAGLMGIVQENELWFSDTKFVNDGSEFRWGLTILQEAIGQMIPTLRDPEQDFLGRVFASIEELHNDFRKVIFCMSSDGNLLNQWRDYGKDVVPYSIELDSSFFFGEQGAAFSVFQGDLIYEKAIQIRLVKSILSECLKLMALAWGRASSKEIEDHAFNVGHQVSLALDRFKNPAFSAEQETRLYRSHYTVSRSIDPKFRVGPLGIVPYYSFKPATRLPILSVRVGPSPYADASKEALETFLKANGLDVPVLKSDIPIRR